MSKRHLLLGLIGANIMRSVSPALFGDAFAAAGIDGFYHLMDVDRLPERRLAKLLDAIKAAGFAGANITYPFKQDVIALLDTVDQEAAQIGAVNTVAIEPDGRTIGYNFDRRGWRNGFEEGLGRDSARGSMVVVVGAGGAGRAVAFALMDLGAGVIVIHDRDGARANALNADLAKHYGASRCRVTTDLERDIAAAQGVVNATQVGMRGFPGNPVPAFALKASHWAADVIYTPIATEFRQRGTCDQRRRNVRTPGGRGIPAVYRHRPRRGPHASRLRHGACRARERNERSDLTQLISTRRGPWAE